MGTPIPVRLRGDSPLIAAEDIHYSLKDKSVTQCQMWMVSASELVLKFADLGGGTLFDWWETHIAQARFVWGGKFCVLARRGA